MSADPLVTHLKRESQGKGPAWFFAGICQLWIWAQRCDRTRFPVLGGGSTRLHGHLRTKVLAMHVSRRGYGAT
jgi:hypothetical protein